MTRLALTGGAYQSRSVIASAQRSLNLFQEPLPQQQGEPSQFAHYPTPGLRLLGTLPQSRIRGIKQVTTGGIYAVAGSGVYLVDPTAWTGTLVGSITGSRPYPVAMQDNGNTLVVVDGIGGWTVDLASNAFAAITDAAFYPADRVDYLDTYLLFNKAGTPQFFSSDSLATTFDPLWFANKQSFSDLLITLAVAKREIWLLGERTTEVWFNAGAADFPFQQVQSVFVDHGIRAKYSVATYDDAVYWLGYDRAGQGIVLQGAGYATKRISTYAIEAELTTYRRIDDAVGFVYSLGGHVFYVLTFPHDDHTWVFDITTGQWHEWLWIDNNGEEHRHRLNCAYAINGMVVGGDWQNGNLYAVESSVYSDNGQPIKRQRSYPHIINDADRVFYRQFVADVESGNPADASPTVTRASAPTPQLPTIGPQYLQVGFNPSPDYALLGGSYVLSTNMFCQRNSGNPNTLPMGDPRHIYIDVTAPPTAGVVKLDGSPASRFTYQNVLDHRVVYTNTNTSAAEDTFDVWARVNENSALLPLTPKFVVSCPPVHSGATQQGAYVNAMVVGGPTGPTFTGGFSTTPQFGYQPFQVTTTQPNSLVLIYTVNRKGSLSSAPPAMLGSVSYAGLSFARLQTATVNVVAFFGAVLTHVTYSLDIFWAVVPTATDANATVTVSPAPDDYVFAGASVFANLANPASPFDSNASNLQLVVSSALPYTGLSMTPTAAERSILPVLFEMVTGDNGTSTNGAGGGNAPFGYGTLFSGGISGGGSTGGRATGDGTLIVSARGPATNRADYWLTGTPPIPPDPPPSALAFDRGRLIFLDWSDDRGHSWGNPVGQPIGDRGEYLTSCQWQRLGMARDRCFRLTWSVPVATALQGAWIEVDARAKT